MLSIKIYVKALRWSDDIKLNRFATELRQVMGWMLFCHFCSNVFWSFTILIAWSCLFALPAPISIFFTTERREKLERIEEKMVYHFCSFL